MSRSTTATPRLPVRSAAFAPRMLRRKRLLRVLRVRWRPPRRRPPHAHTCEQCYSLPIASRRLVQLVQLVQLVGLGLVALQLAW